MIQRYPSNSGACGDVRDSSVAGARSVLRVIRTAYCCVDSPATPSLVYAAHYTASLAPGRCLRLEMRGLRGFRPTTRYRTLRRVNFRPGNGSQLLRTVVRTNATCCYYVAAKATYVRLLYGQKWGFSALAP